MYKCERETHIAVGTHKSFDQVLVRLSLGRGRPTPSGAPEIALGAHGRIPFRRPCGHRVDFPRVEVASVLLILVAHAGVVNPRGDAVVPAHVSLEARTHLREGRPSVGHTFTL